MLDTIVMKVLLALLIVIASFLLYSTTVSGQEISDSDEFSLGISPPILEITADPPAKIESKINIQNLSEEPQNLSIVYKSFRLSQDGTGRIEYPNLDNEIIGPDPLILQKIKVYEGENPVERISLDPLEAKELTLVINIERSAPLGDYYFSVIFLSQAEASFDQTGIQSPGGIGTNVILSVGKKGPTRGEISKFSTPLSVFNGPVPITLLVRNNSDQYITPRGRISIKNILGQDVGRLDILPQYILANSQRYMIDSGQASPSSTLTNLVNKYARGHNVLLWQERFLLGLYSVNAHVMLSETGPEFDTNTYFIAIPLYVIFAVAFFVFILLGIYLRVKRKV